MPYYEFQCTQCGEKFGLKRTFEEYDRHKSVKCPKCGSTKSNPVLSPTFVKTSKKS